MIFLQMQGKCQKFGIINFECFEVYYGIVKVLVVFFCEVVVQRSRCADVVYKMNRAFILPHDEAGGLSLQGRDLSNSQMGAFPKSILLHYALCEISQKAR